MVSRRARGLGDAELVLLATTLFVAELVDVPRLFFAVVAIRALDHLARIRDALLDHDRRASQGGRP